MARFDSAKATPAEKLRAADRLQRIGMVADAEMLRRLAAEDLYEDLHASPGELAERQRRAEQRALQRKAEERRHAERQRYHAAQFRAKMDALAKERERHRVESVARYREAALRWTGYAERDVRVALLSVRDGCSELAFGALGAAQTSYARVAEFQQEEARLRGEPYSPGQPFWEFARSVRL